jgi:hypothetical protein
MLAHIHQLGGGLVVITPVSPVDPGFGQPGGPVDPGYGRPGWSPVDPGYGHRPGAGHIDNTLPGAPGHPDNRPPGRPPHVASGDVLVLVRDQAGVWHYATLPPGATPKPLPPPTEPAPAPKG